MIHLDRFEKLSIKTPWAPKGLIERAKASLESVERSFVLKKMGLKPQIFAHEEEAFERFLFAWIQEKTLGEGKNHLLIPEGLRTSLRAVIALFEPFGLIVETMPLDPQGKIHLERFAENVYPTTMGCIVEPYDLLTGIEQPLEALKEILGTGRILYLVSQTQFGWHGIGPKIDAVQMGAIVWVPYGWNVRGIQDPDVQIATTSTLQEALDKHTEHAMQQAYLKRFFERGLKALGADLYFSEVKRYAGTLVFGFPNVHGELLAYYLAQKGIFLSIGGGDRPALHAHLLRIGIDEEKAVTAVHCTLGTDLNEEQLQKVLDEIEAVLSLCGV